MTVRAEDRTRLFAKGASQTGSIALFSCFSSFRTAGGRALWPRFARSEQCCSNAARAVNALGGTAGIVIPMESSAMA